MYSVIWDVFLSFRQSISRLPLQWPIQNRTLLVRWTFLFLYWWPCMVNDFAISCLISSLESWGNNFFLLVHFLGTMRACSPKLQPKVFRLFRQYQKILSVSWALLGLKLFFESCFGVDTILLGHCILTTSTLGIFKAPTVDVYPQILNHGLNFVILIGSFWQFSSWTDSFYGLFKSYLRLVKRLLLHFLFTLKTYSWLHFQIERLIFEV